MLTHEENELPSTVTYLSTAVATTSYRNRPRREKRCA
jgi:hypothetical protein